MFSILVVQDGYQCERPVIQVEALPPAAVPEPVLASSVLDQDAAHGLGRGGEEVASAIPRLLRVRSNKPQVRLVDEGGRLQRLPGLLRRQTGGCESPQFVVDDRQQVVGRPAAAASSRRVTSGMRPSLTAAARPGTDNPPLMKRTTTI
jgi:hypothetical protein